MLGDGIPCTKETPCTACAVGKAIEDERKAAKAAAEKRRKADHAGAVQS